MRWPSRPAVLSGRCSVRHFVERIGIEPFWLRSPCLADELVGREALEGLQSTAEVIGADEVVEMLPELLVAVVMIKLDGRFLDGSVHPLDLAIGPRVIGLGQAMLDAVILAGTIELMAAPQGCQA